jgi:hypothetical protein
MNRIIALLFLSVGIVCTLYGISSSDSISSTFSRFLTGTPTDQTIWLLLGGIVAILVGVGGILRSGKSS